MIRSLRGRQLIRLAVLALALAAALVLLTLEPAWARSLQQEFTPRTYEEFPWNPWVVGYTIACAVFYGTLAIWLMTQGRRTA